ncbi:MAG: L-serine ammonia-lyase, iron-sulfur-dependent, subunit alpha [Sphaerochaetaceae bacterium]|nr:L-serine ammonia-lyase, iron-sulfur-dependent, subunit alpha [Sphaerochaetaceae bacterium]
MTDSEFLALLKKEMVPAMGCTEPAAAALAGAKAKELLKDNPIEKTVVRASRNMIKNAMGVGLPNCEQKGILMAVALGIVKGSTDKELSILSRLTEKEIEKAKTIKAELILEENVPQLYVSVELSGAGHSAKATISGEHNRFSFCSVDGEVLVDLPLETEETKNCEDSEHTAKMQKERSSLLDVRIKDIKAFADRVNIEELSFIKDAISTNRKIAEHALKNPYGLKVGMTMADGQSVKTVKTLKEAFNLAASYAAAGSDARMSGLSMPVIINSGSGNQGLTVTLPLYVLSKFLKKDEETLLRATCISELIGLALTARKNRLSALCGAFTAAIGTSCAYVYLLGGSVSQMEGAVNNMVGNLTGIICDGAKTTCALKIFSCLQAAATSAELAMHNTAPGKESGIVGDDGSKSIDYLSRVSSEGMENVDSTVLSIMMEKC